MCHWQPSFADRFFSEHCWGVSPVYVVLLRRTVKSLGFNKAFKFILNFNSCYFYKIHFLSLLWVPQWLFSPRKWLHQGHLLSLVCRISLLFKRQQEWLEMWLVLMINSTKNYKFQTTSELYRVLHLNLSCSPMEAPRQERHSWRAVNSQNPE